MHNTLASSDYGLLEEDTLEPRPNYWAAILWNRTMGATVLNPQAAANPSLRVFAHCMKDTRGGVSLLILNTNSTAEQTLDLPTAADRYTLTAPTLTSKTVLLNSKQLTAAADGSLPPIKGQPIKSGNIHLAPATITFLAIPTAANTNCR
jgi:hypothetical protein